MTTTLKIFTIFALMFVLIQNSHSQQNQNGWFWTNSQPQANELKWVKIVDATHYYAIGGKGTFMRSSDAGDSWLINTQAGQPEPFFGSGGTTDLYSAWFFNANTGLVGGNSSDDFGPGKIKRTTDGGETFSSIGIGNAPGFSRINDFYFLDENTGYLCGNENVSARKTTNGGLNWTSLPNLPIYTYTCVYAYDVNNIILGTSFDSGSRIIVRTTNGGASWTVITLPGTTQVEINDIEFQNANTGFIAGYSSYFAYTTNGGANWIQAIFPNNEMGLYGLKIIGSNVYTLGSYNSYYYTSNLGVTWDSVNFNDPSNLNQPYTTEVYSFDINGSDAIVVGLQGKVNVSNDGGGTWRNKNYSVGNNTYTMLSVFALPGTGEVWSGSEFGGLILHSTNSGTNWTKQQTNASFAFNDFSMINSMTGYTVGGTPFFTPTGFCYKTTNGGANWNSLTIPSPNTPRFSVDFVNSTTGWMFGGTYNVVGLISKTTNGGANWVSQTTTPVHNSVIFDGDMYDANTGYCIGGYTFASSTMNLFKTTNGGSNWNLVYTFPTELPWSALQTFSPTTLYLGGENKIYKSTNSGVNWTEATLPSVTKIRNMDWSDLNNGTVVGIEGYTAKTSNAGLNWTERNTGTSSIDGVSMPNKDTVFSAAGLNDNGAILRLYDDVSSGITFNITIGIEGFWNGVTQVTDTVKCHLRNSTAPYAEVEVATAVMNSSGQATFTFNSAPAGSYYLEITQRNSIETWSGLPQVIVTGGSHNYDFTTSASQAFGDNMILTSGRYCDYSGDIDQDGAVNLTDVVQTYNASSVFTTGYVPTDVTGNNVVDLSDITIVYNNARAFVAKVTP